MPRNPEHTPGFVSGPRLVVDGKEFFVQDGSPVGQEALLIGKHLLMTDKGWRARFLHAHRHRVSRVARPRRICAGP